jgi:hypothetical protein
LPRGVQVAPGAGEAAARRRVDTPLDAVVDGAPWTAIRPRGARRHERLRSVGEVDLAPGRRVGAEEEVVDAVEEVRAF